MLLPMREPANNTRAYRQPAVLLWLLGLLLCAIVIGRTSFTADLSAFLPRSPSAEQRDRKSVV